MSRAKFFGWAKRTDRCRLVVGSISVCAAGGITIICRRWKDPAHLHIDLDDDQAEALLRDLKRAVRTINPNRGARP